MTEAQKIAQAEEIGEAMNQFTDVRGWEIEDDRHSLVMVLTDLIQFARTQNISFDTVLAEARELDDECNA